MWMENYCDECDAVIDTRCRERDFWAHNVGRVRRPKCGAIMMPCNECARDTPLNERDCANCPWAEAEILDEIQ